MPAQLINVREACGFICSSRITQYRLVKSGNNCALNFWRGAGNSSLPIWPRFWSGRRSTKEKSR